MVKQRRGGVEKDKSSAALRLCARSILPSADCSGYDDLQMKRRVFDIVAAGSLALWLAVMDVSGSWRRLLVADLGRPIRIDRDLSPAVVHVPSCSRQERQYRTVREAASDICFSVAEQRMKIDFRRPIARQGE